MHTSHDALWRLLGRPSALPSSFPRWNSVDQPDYVFLSLPCSLLFSSPQPPPLSLVHSIFLSLLSSLRCFAVTLTLSFFFPPFLSLSFLLPHYLTHNRTPRARKKDATAFALHCSFAACTWSRSAFATCVSFTRNLQKVLLTSKITAIDFYHKFTKAQERFDWRQLILIISNSNYLKLRFYLPVNSVLMTPSVIRIKLHNAI